MLRIKDKKILITGINGFIGKNMAGLFIEKGATVAGLPREFLLNPAEMQKILEDIKPDIIVHLAAFGNRSGQKDDIDEIFITNIVKTYNLLRATANINYQALINVSTSSVYGVKDVPMSEDMKLNPTDYYSYTKQAGEVIAKMYADTLDKPIVTVRPFSVYGQGEGVERFIPTVINRIENGGVLKLAEKPVHDWIHVEDFVNGVIKVINNVDKLCGQVVNIGTGEQYSNAKIVDILLGFCDAPKCTVEVLEDQRNYDTSTMWKADNEKLKSLGWEQKHTINKGLMVTYKFYKEYFEKIKEDDPVRASLDMMGIKFEDPKEKLDLMEKVKNERPKK